MYILQPEELPKKDRAYLVFDTNINDLILPILLTVDATRADGETYTHYVQFIGRDYSGEMEERRVNVTEDNAIVYYDISDSFTHEDMFYLRMKFEMSAGTVKDIPIILKLMEDTTSPDW